jgi:soluble lytic murein transglycosylase
VTLRRFLLPVVLTFSCATTALDPRAWAAPAAAQPVKKHKTRRPASRKRLLRIHQAFVASATLRPMAQQLLRERTAAAYAGVEAYARKHSPEDAGALAWLVLGYAHTLDHDPAKALPALQKAQPKAGDLADYVTYFLASAYQQTGAPKQAEVLLRDFDAKFTGSIFARDAHVTRANALIALGRAPEAIALLEKDRVPARADVELVLGRAYAATGDRSRAAASLRAVYYTMPLSAETDEAEKELGRLSGQIPPPAFADRKTRAELLLRGKRANEAVTEYRALVGDASAQERPGLEIALAGALRATGRTRDAKQVLQLATSTTGEANAQRLFLLADMARAGDDETAFLSSLGQLRQAAPTSPWLEQALLGAGNFYLLRKDYGQASAYYHEMSERFPTGSRASYAHWKATWLMWRQGQGAEARREFERQIQLFPDSAETPAALYWRGRAAEEDGDPGRARAYYEKLSTRYLNFYYAELARQRLKESLRGVALTADPVLDHLAPPVPPALGTFRETPPDNLHVQKARLLANGALLDFAIRELQAAVSEEGGSWEVAEMARVCQDSGRYDRSIEVVKRAFPNYFALPLGALPRDYWQGLFPKPYWTDLKKSALENGLDPFLVASLIRQESAFNPTAISHANAVGLMQLLPSTARTVAREIKLRRFSTPQLTDPVINMKLGAHHFRALSDQFGAPEYALAAYNAGAERVQEWMAAGKYRDLPEFVESIPFTETREYVQAILRNASVYRQLYGAP